MKVDRRRPDILVLDEALLETELASLGRAAASADLEAQDLSRGASTARRRAVVESGEIAQLLWRVVAPHLGAPSE